MNEKEISQKAKFFLSLVGASSLVVPLFLWYLYNNFIFPSPKFDPQLVSNTPSVVREENFVSQDSSTPSAAFGSEIFPDQVSSNSATQSSEALAGKKGEKSSSSSSQPAENSGQVAGIQSNPHQEISPSELFNSLMEESPLILDIRSPEEFKANHLPGASNLPQEYLAYLDGYLDQNGGGLQKDKPTVVYNSSSDELSVTGMAEKLVGYGFTRVYVLTGGYEAWEREGYPFEK